MPHYCLVPGTRIEPIGEGWASWSPASGETHILNDEAAAIVEVLDELGSLDADAVVSNLIDGGQAEPAQRESLRIVVELSLSFLAEAGIVRLAPESRM